MRIFLTNNPVKFHSAPIGLFKRDPNKNANNNKTSSSSLVQIITDDPRCMEKSKSACGIGWVDRAGGWRRYTVSLGVEGEVIGSRESTSAVAAHERPVSGVFAAVTRQLIRPRELPSAPRPLALVRLLAYKIHQCHMHKRVSIYRPNSISVYSY